MDEVKDKSGQQMDVLSWKQEGVENLPLQMNGYFSSLFLASIVVLPFLLAQLMNSFLLKKIACNYHLPLYEPENIIVS